MTAPTMTAPTHKLASPAMTNKCIQLMALAALSSTYCADENELQTSAQETSTSPNDEATPSTTSADDVSKDTIESEVDADKVDADSEFAQSPNNTSVESTAPSPGYECTSDSDCSKGAFCDLGKCAELNEEFGYGKECLPDAGYTDSTFCILYPCVDGRCRSCTSTDSCEPTYGEPTQCLESADRPGWICALNKPHLPPPSSED